MAESEEGSRRAASKEVSSELKTLINGDDLDSLKQLQYLMYTSSLSLALSSLLNLSRQPTDFTLRLDIYEFFFSYKYLSCAFETG